MTEDTFGEIEGVGMDDAEIETFLRERGIGVLSLASDAEAYGVPISFGYDGDDRLCFVFLRVGERSRKRSSPEPPNGRASPPTWWSRSTSGGA